jgi:hypothetical protein
MSEPAQVLVDAAFWKRLEEHMEKEDERERVLLDAKQWHVGKEIPIATIIVLILQTCAVIWWAASTAAKVEFMKETIVADRSSQIATDARQDLLAREGDNRISTQLEKVDRKLDRLIEGKR